MSVKRNIQCTSKVCRRVDCCHTSIHTTCEELSQHLNQVVSITPTFTKTAFATTTTTTAIATTTTALTAATTSKQQQQQQQHQEQQQQQQQQQQQR